MNTGVYYQRELVLWRGVSALLLAVFTYVYLVSERSLISPSEINGIFLVREALSIAMVLLYWVATWLMTSRRWAFMAEVLRWCAVVLIIILTVVMGTLLSIADRHGDETVPIHDSALQTEYAYHNLTAGINPYQSTYHGTALERQWPVIWPGVANPALEHYVYLPAMFMVSGIVGSVENALMGWEDIRLLLIAVFLLSLALFVYMLRGQPWAQFIIIVFALNPLGYTFLIHGRNDILLLFFILAALIALMRQRLVVSGLALGVALAMKQFAWLLMPIIVLYLLRPQLGPWRARIQNAARFVLPASLIFSLFVIPFIIWDGRAFFDDIILYPAGSTALAYPVAGFGFSSLLRLTGIVEFDTQFSFILLMFPAMLIVICAVWRRLWRQPSLSQAVIYATMTLAAGSFFSRYFTSNHFAFLLYMVIVWIAFWLWEHPLLDSEKAE